jgi:hypothetical protein
MSAKRNPTVSRGLWIFCGLASAVLTLLLAVTYFRAPAESRGTPAIIAAGAVPLGACALMMLLADLGHSARHSVVSVLGKAQDHQDEP